MGSRSGIVRIAWMDFGGWWDVAAFRGWGGGLVVCRFVGRVAWRFKMEYGIKGW